MNIDDSILKFTLYNAYLHNGKANKGSVIGKLIAENKEIKKELKEIIPKIDKIINKVNTMNKSEQEIALKNYPELFENKNKEKTLKDLFKFFNIKEGDHIITAFPPGPEKYPHIGHAKAALLNYLLAKEYNGQFILRFEDTNPKLVKEEFYKIFEEDLKWLGIKWDKLVYASDYLNVLYDFAEKLIKTENAYVCSCGTEKIRENRAKGISCECRNRSINENMELWKQMFEGKEGMILRLKIDMKHKNTTMRDPAIFRIIKHKHPRKNAIVWPIYDFQNSVLDGYLGVTHRLRTKEFELRSELHNYIQKLLNLTQTKTYEFARFNLKDIETSGRKIRALIEEGKLTGWDDPQLVTLRALKRRGIQAEAIKDFVINTGITKNESELTIEELFNINRKYLDERAYRFFFIKEPIKIKINNAPKRKIKLKLHPTKDLGFREFECNEEFYIEKKDFEKLENGLYRLMDNLNFEFKDGQFYYHSDNYLEFKEKGKGIMHWLPMNVKEITLLMPNGEEINGIVENNIEKLKVDQVCQFERFGFVRKDKEDYFIFTHK